MMKRILVITAILVLAAVPAMAQEWTLSTEIGDAPIEALAAGPGGTAWAAMNSDNRIFHFDGSEWSVQTVLTGWSGSFWTAFALNSGEVWLYGNLAPSGGGGKAAPPAVVAYFNGDAWQLFTAPNYQEDNALYASGPNDLWLGSSNGVVHRSSNSGASWQAETLPAGAVFITGLAGSSPNSIWAVSQGVRDVIYAAHYDGVSWTGYTVFSTAIGSTPRVAIPGGIPVCVFWAPCGATVYEFRGGAWNQTTVIPGEDYLYLSSAPGAADVWMSGYTGNLYYRNGSDWTVQTTFGEQPYGVSARNGTVWVSTEGRIYRRQPRRSPRGDFSGDGTSDIGVFRPASGLWAVRGVTRAYFGGSSDQPVGRDYRGDGTSDVAVFRPASGLWAVRGVTRAYFGGSNDQPVPGDYRGNGTSDVGVFRPASGLWAVKGVTRAYFGSSSDQPVPGNYRGDGTSDVAVFRPATGLWAVRGVTRAYFGGGSDIPVPSDYRGDGTSDIAVFRPATGLWAVRGVTRIYYGSSSDQPVPADFRGDGTSDIGVFRPASGLWAVRYVTRAYYGQSGDIQVINPPLPTPPPPR